MFLKDTCSFGMKFEIARTLFSTCKAEKYHKAACLVDRTFGQPPVAVCARLLFKKRMYEARDVHGDVQM